MNQKYKPAFFTFVVAAVMAPYFGFVGYFSLQYPSGHWPMWLVNTLAIWFIVNFLIILLLFKRMSRGHVVDPEKVRIAVAKSKAFSTRLLIIWSLLFLYGVTETVRGKLPLNRAIPAGMFLLAFIGIFGWSVYRARTEKP